MLAVRYNGRSHINVMNATDTTVDVATSISIYAGYMANQLKQDQRSVITTEPKKKKRSNEYRQQGITKISTCIHLLALRMSLSLKMCFFSYRYENLLILKFKIDGKGFEANKRIHTTGWLCVYLLCVSISLPPSPPFHFAKIIFITCIESRIKRI